MAVPLGAAGGKQVSRTRKLLSAVAPLFALFPIFGPSPSPSPSPTPTATASTYPCSIVDGQVTVTDCGPTGTSDDTATVQTANDVAAAEGGGRVFFPAGTYMVSSVFQDSHVEFAGEAGSKLLRLPGSNHALIRSRVQPWVRGTMTAGSSKLTGLTTTDELEVGSVVAVLGAAGGSKAQATTLSLGAPLANSPIRLKDTTGFEPAERNYLLLNNEIISYTGLFGDTLSGVQRAHFGTYRVSHAAGSPISQLRVLYATVVAIDAGGVTLDRAATKTVKSTFVWWGAKDLKVTGLELDGNPSSNNGRYTFVLQYNLARNVVITGSTISNGQHGAMILSKGTADSVVEGNQLVDNAGSDGSSIWLYHGAERNTIRNNTISDTGPEPSSGIRIDDRTATTSYWDGPGLQNVVEGNTISTKAHSMYTKGVSVEGSSFNRIQGNTINGGSVALRILQGRYMGYQVGPATSNVIDSNTFTGQTTGVIVNGDRNEFTSNTFGQTYADCRDDGASNVFTANVTDKAGFVCE